MQEFDANDPDSLDHAWKQHDWTGEEAQFAAQVLQHGDVARAWAAAHDWGGDQAPNRMQCEIQGARLMNEVWMQRYIAFVRDRIKQRMAVTKERILEELSLLAFANQADFIVIQKDGTAYTDLSSMTREQLAAIQEITVDTYMEGKGEDAERVKSVKIKLAPKTAALELLGKNQRLFADVLEHSDLTDISETMTARRAERRKRIKEEETPADVDED